jgi:hypothetical protein
LRICFLSLQINAIVGFSARLNGIRLGRPAKMSSRQKQERPSLRIPVKATMDSDAWRPLDPVDDDQGGA